VRADYCKAVSADYCKVGWQRTRSSIPARISDVLTSVSFAGQARSGSLLGAINISVSGWILRRVGKPSLEAFPNFLTVYRRGRRSTYTQPNTIAADRNYGDDYIADHNLLARFAAENQHG
jgi:hypothetical protein